MADDNRQPTRFNKSAELLRWLPAGLVQEIARRWEALNEILAADTGSFFYEVLDYSISLELLDPEGRRAVVHRREVIRALDDGVRAAQHVCWGNGNVLKDYRSTLGDPFHEMDREGRTHLLMWLDRPMARGQTRVIESEQVQQNTYRTSAEWQVVEIRHMTRRATGSIIFPKDRHPTKVEVRRQFPRPLGTSRVRHTTLRMKDGRYLIGWTTEFPPIGTEIRTEWQW